MLNKVAWYVQRLRVMNLKELLHRSSERLYVATCFLDLLRGLRPSRYKLTDIKFATTESSYFHSSEYFDIPSSLPSNNNSYLGYEWRWNGQDSSWHLAPDTMRCWPKLFFNKIDYRQGNPTGDIRVTWEVSRFQRQLNQVAKTAASHSISTDQKSEVYHQVLDQIKSWWSANPHTIGVHYISSMECALRLIAITHIIDTIRIELTEEDWQTYLNFVAQHADFILHRLSLYSSAGNHTVAEATGLVYAGALFPELKNATTWLDTGTELLNVELCRQIHQDGGSLEQTTWYLKFIVDLGSLANTLLTRESRALEPKTQQRLKSAAFFLWSLRSSASFCFEYGDSDHGYALSPMLKLVHCDDVAEAEVSHFDDTGVELFDLALATDESARIKVIFLTKNLGMAPLFGHGHADCLSVCIAVNGCPMLIDTGTFGYNIGDKWRRHFRSVHAHNTVSVNNLDQSNQLSNFQWSRDIATQTLVAPKKSGDRVYYCFARHFGFQSAGAIHCRAVIVNQLGELVVWDRVIGKEKMEVVANWHFATSIDDGNDYFETVVGGVNVRVETSTTATELVHGAERPVAGWSSDSYGIKHGIDTLRLVENGREDVSLLTRFTFAGSRARDAWWETHIAELEKLI